MVESHGVYTLKNNLSFIATYAKKKRKGKKRKRGAPLSARSLLT